MDLYVPAGLKPASPGIIIVHGGGWSGGSRNSMAKAAQAAAQHGYLAFNIDYRVRPPNVAREAADVVAAISDVRAHAARFHLDPTRLSGLGASSGAQLVTQAALVDHAPLRAVVGWSGPYDLVAQLDGEHADTPQRIQLQRMMPRVLGCAIPHCRIAAAAQSPARHVGRHEPPVMLFNAAHELVPTDQMGVLTAALRGNGDRVTTDTVPGDRHAEQYTSDAIGPSLRFLDGI
jgi:acetyl esterase/lipase